MDLGSVVMIYSDGFVVRGGWRMGHDESQLLCGEERRSVNRTDGEFDFGLDKIGHWLSELQEITLVHLIWFLRGLVKSGKANEREGIDAKKSEALLRFFELDASKEEIKVRVIGDEG